MNDIENYRQARQAAADAIVKWFRDGKGYLEMRQKVNDCFEASGANSQSTEEGTIAHRKLVASHILNYALYGLDEVQSKNAEQLLNTIAEQDAPSVSRGYHR